MIEVTIPGYKTLQFKHLVLDYNGTLAVDGELLPGVKEALKGLSEELQVHIMGPSRWMESFCQVSRRR
jgi:soluble P-type ATPase